MKYVIAIPILSMFFFGSIAYADGYAQTLDKAVGNYIANVDYDSFTPEIYVQTPTSFSFQLWNKDRTETVPFDDVSVNIFEQNVQDSIFSGTLSDVFGQSGMKYVFEHPGTYTMQVRFHNEKYETLADASFPLTVDAASTAFKQIGITASVCLCVAMASFWLVQRRKKKTNAT